jgi:Uncharacterized protein conserved in bacteria
MAVTKFGKILRKIRIDRNEVLLDMANKLKVTASYLSAVENGKRNIPISWLDFLPAIYELPEQAVEELEQAAGAQISSVRLDFDGTNPKSNEVAFAFARRIDELDDETIERLKAILTKKEKTE